MRLRTVVPTLVAFSLAGGGALFAASYAVSGIERRSVEDVRAALVAKGHTWAVVMADGLQLTVSGTAEDEATRFNALSVAGSVVDPARVIDRMGVATPEAVEPPRFSIELLRNDGGVQVIGLIPASADREALIGRIRGIAGDAEVTDLLESAAFPAPRGWQGAVGFGLDALDTLPRAKVSIAADRVSVTAMSDSRAEKRKIESDLARRAPDGVRLALDIAAPRPVITPFTLRFLIDEGGARFDACSAATEAGRDVILKAAAEAGLDGKIDCTIGMGVPSPDWPQAVRLGIEAVSGMGGGTLTFSDADISLVALQTVSQADFDREVGKLEGALPDVFALRAVKPEPPEEAEPEAEGPPQFVATRSPEGLVQLRGRVPDDRTRAAIETFARARFGAASIDDASRTDTGLPAGWGPQVLAALDAMALLHNGAVVVEPEHVELSGVSGVKEARAEAARILAAQLGQGVEFDISIRYDESLDAEAGLPSPEECQERIGAILAKRQITFAPGSDTIDAEARETIDQIADTLRQCTDVQMEIAGHTDSQGRESMNLGLSQARAESVLAALMARRVVTSNLTAKGYGEANPIADNDTEEGREANRRIEFTLIEADAPEGEGAVDTAAETGEEDAAATDEDAAEASGE